LEDRGWTAWEATTAVNPAYYEETGEDWLYEYGRVANRLTNRQLRAILGREPESQAKKALELLSFNWQILFLSIPALAALLLAVRAIHRYGILLPAWLRPDRNSTIKILGKIVDGYHRRGVNRPDTLGWGGWAEAIGHAVPIVRNRSRRLLTVIQKLIYSDQGFRIRDLRYIRAFYLNYCKRSAAKRG
jgi:hypothetical protein